MKQTYETVNPGAPHLVTTGLRLRLLRWLRYKPQKTPSSSYVCFPSVHASSKGVNQLSLNFVLSYLHLLIKLQRLVSQKIRPFQKKNSIKSIYKLHF